MTPRIVPFSVVLAVGCAESDMLAKGSFDTGAAMEAGEDAATDDAGPARLRVDVVPNGDSAFLPQSVTFELATQDTATLLSDLVVQLAPSRTMAGRISAFEAAPYGDVSVPGTLAAPFVGRISMSAESGLARRSVDTSSGDFTLRLPAGEYRMAVLPADSEMQPFYILDPYSLQQDDSDFELELGFGSPVYGRAVQADGTPAPGITEVWLEDTLTGLSGPRVATDGAGNYMLRAFPGAYRVVAEGNERSTIPRVAAPVTVIEETAARVDLGLGTVSPVEASGRVLDADGSGLYQATIRFTSLALDDAEGHMVVEDDTDSDGDFELDVLPGLWKVEIIPPFDSDGDLAPVRLDDVEVDGDGVDLSAVTVPERARVTGTVAGPTGEAVGAVTVVAREVGFDHYVYTALTGNNGEFELDVPDVPLEVAFLPPDEQHTVTWVDYPQGMSGREQVTLASGLPVSGRIRSTSGGVGAALVELMDADTGRSYGSALTDENGNFTLRVALDEGGGWNETDAADTGF